MNILKHSKSDRFEKSTVFKIAIMIHMEVGISEMSDTLSHPFKNVRLFDWSVLIEHLVSGNERLQSHVRESSQSSATPRTLTDIEG